jgi:8-oxo-dGTP pyrophosphatase MutT (NUDIX family)
MREIAEIRKKAEGRQLKEIRPVRRENAVLIPLVEAEEGLSVLFEVRQAAIRQGGEICFPGGRVESGETARSAAVRETSEELLIPQENIEWIAPMHAMSGPGGARISSGLGLLHGYEGTCSEAEVARVFTVPLGWFAENPPRVCTGAMVVETGEDFPYELLPGGRNYPWHKIPRTFYFYEYRGEVIWGITAELLYHCLKALGIGASSPGAFAQGASARREE